VGGWCLTPYPGRFTAGNDPILCGRGGRVDPRAGVGDLEKREKCLLPARIRIPDRPIPNLATIQTELFRLMIIIMMIIIITGIIPKSLSQSLKRPNLHPNTYIQMQTVVILGTCSIVRNFLNYT
jgi:hypothetical protein